MCQCTIQTFANAKNRFISYANFHCVSLFGFFFSCANSLHVFVHRRDLKSSLSALIICWLVGIMQAQTNISQPTREYESGFCVCLSVFTKCGQKFRLFVKREMQNHRDTNPNAWQIVNKTNNPEHTNAESRSERKKNKQT